MRKILALAIGAVLACVASAPATTLSADVRVTPDRAGTVARPQGVKLGIKLHLDVPDGLDHPMVTRFEVWHGPGLAFDRGKGYPACSLSVLETGGPDACPAMSVMGKGSGQADVDGPEARPKAVIVNGPGRLPIAYLTLQRPARVRAPSVPTVIDNPRSVWPHRTSWPIPPTMRVVAGIPITFNDLAFSYGFKSWAPYYIAAVDCPRGGWAWRMRVHTVDAHGVKGLLQTQGRVPCHR